MDTISLTHSSNGLEQNSVGFANNPLSNTDRANATSGYGLSSLSSSSHHLIVSQNGTAGDDWLQSNDSHSTLYGLAGNDLILGNFRQANVLFGNDGNDRMRGGHQDDLLNGGADRDRLMGERGNDLLVGGLGNDTLLAGQGSDTLKASAGSDRLRGEVGNDSLDGGAGVDCLNGGNGDDVMLDYEGGDRLTGGAGSDQFGVGSPLATQASIITDFQVGTDQVKILRLGATFEDLTCHDRNGSTQVLDQGNVIAILSGINAIRLNADSFMFGDAQLAETLQTNLDQSLAANPQATGLSATVFAPDGTVWLGFAGVADRESQDSIDADSLFGVGSITKPIVATVVLQLQEEGTLSLDDTLSQWLPDLASDIPNSDRITIRQLLGHTSGIRDYTTEPELIERFTNDPTALSQSYTSEQLLSYIAGKPALLEPGQGFSYSNSNYVLLGEIIEKATGSTLASQLQQRIFAPLGMNQTFFAPQESVSQENLTHSYDDLDGDGQLDDLNENLSWTNAAGGVVSTAADIAKFSQALFQGELLAPATLQTMIHDSSKIGLVGDLENYRYGLGVESGQQPGLGEFWGHDGATVGWQSDLVYLPDRQITATALATASENSSQDIAIQLVLQNLQNTVQSST